jgi:hypothetical protein
MVVLIASAFFTPFPDVRCFAVASLFVVGIYALTVASTEYALKLIKIMLTAVEKPKIKKPRKPKAAPTGITTVSSDSPTKASGSPRKGGTPKKKGKKRNPWSDESDVSEVDSDRSDGEMDNSFSDVMQRDKAPRRAAGKGRPKFIYTSNKTCPKIRLRCLSFILINLIFQD